MQQFKSWATRAMKKHGESGPFWTRHGSTRYLNDRDSVAQAVDYVKRFQDGYKLP